MSTLGTTHKLSSVALHVPRYGIPHATLETPDDAAMPAGATTLTVADLVLSCVVVESFRRRGVTTARVVGGRGGWRSVAPPDGGKRNDAGVKLSTLVDTLARAVGETAQLLADVDRRCGSPVARFGSRAADALTALCASPAAAAPVPWHVSLAGVTVLGARTGAAVTLETLEAPVGPVYLFGDESGLLDLLPGNLIDGRTIDVLRVHAVADKIRAEAIVS